MILENLRLALKDLASKQLLSPLGNGRNRLYEVIPQRDKRRKEAGPPESRTAPSWEWSIS